MIGYIYLTINIINKNIYIGKKESHTYDKNYLGSGKILRRAIDKYGKQNFRNIMIDCASSYDELNEKEILYISFYKKQYGDKCYNIASGGNGGNVFRYASEDKIIEFKNKMQAINKERCNTESFKTKISKATKLRYANKDERIRHSKVVRKAWENEELRARQSEIVKSFSKNEEVKIKRSLNLSKRWENEDYKKRVSDSIKKAWTNEKRQKHSDTIKIALSNEITKDKLSKGLRKRWENEDYKIMISEKIREARLREKINYGAESRKEKVVFIFQDEKIIFNSRREFEDYCLNRFGYVFSNKTYMKLLKTKEPFKAYYKKQYHMNGIILYKLDESVETKGDECSPVE